MKFRVQAKNAIGWGEFSEVNENGMAMARKPQTVSGLRQVNKGTDFVELAWDEVTDLGSTGAILYEIQMSKQGGDWFRIRRGFKNSHIAQGLEPGYTYRFKVRAANLCRIGHKVIS